MGVSGHLTLSPHHRDGCTSYSPTCTSSCPPTHCCIYSSEWRRRERYGRLAWRRFCSHQNVGGEGSASLLDRRKTKVPITDSAFGAGRGLIPPGSSHPRILLSTVSLGGRTGSADHFKRHQEATWSARH